MKNSTAGPLALRQLAMPAQQCLRRGGEGVPALSTQREAITAPQRDALTPRKHAQLMAQDENPHLTREVVTFTPQCQQMQPAAK
jgi:hypothetical protein